MHLHVKGGSGGGVSLFLVAALPAKEYKGGMGRSEPDADTARRQELASFLRARRAAIQPADVNLYCRPGRRNTPGLRREEVAQISGVGHTWYTWLEQARAITISESVVEALARAFQLDRDAHAHLRHLAGLPASEPEQISEPADADLTRLLDTLMPAPSCALGSRFDFVAWNESFAAIWDPASLPPGRCNLMWLVFADPVHRRIWTNWPERSRMLLGEFRVAAARHAGDPQFSDLVNDLSEANPQFRELWSGYEVRQSIAGPLRLRHPEIGAMRFNVVELRPSNYPSITVSVHLPARPRDRDKLTALLSRT
jgi:transcriptional regulator with XRE-family HTH domain